MVGFCLHGQYSSVSFENSNSSSLKIVQMDYLQFSTLIHFQYTNRDSLFQICLNENIHIIANEMDPSLLKADYSTSKVFFINWTKYKVHLSKIDEFKKHHPNAEEARTYIIDENIYDIPISKVTDFLENFPDAILFDDSPGSYNKLFDLSILSKEYILLKSYNLPFCNNAHFLDEESPVYNFTLEFEKIPEYARLLDIVDDTNGLLNIKGIVPDERKQVDYLDVSSFTNETPLKELGSFYQDGNKVLYYNHKGITLAVELKTDNNYGKYYQAVILLQNRTGKDLNFFPDQVNSYFQLNQGLINAEILTYDEYMKKVRKRQTWNSLALALSEGLAAASAGYSYTSTTESAYGNSNTNSSAYGSIGNTYGSAYGRSSTYSSAYGRSVTESFNGSEAYAASQNAANNIERYQNQQYEIKRVISDGYAKTNTIPNGSEYICYINIKYIDAKALYLVIPFNDTDYYFWW